ncbi:LacI family DNA-binding transcriptional regulator [Streptosporangium sp. 'caverna']|uniref:LacI family DNA-binding transcriptional regulator n=1 Tax=Streptosporangium sp. 'caverna' TaxID=2202249 RepID=UPI000D7E2E72|nr:LacI family DNA-binding transcriptional regulator [Streptosporangium sp. 'caverna']AWS43607.1 LacI family transcriptional regulator [Streptosporangium sp. 'caverna']
MSGDEDRVTVRDVAARAGVSATTVSRVIQGDYPVAQSTRTRVLRAMRELDYVLNVHARALSGASTKMVAFVLDDVTGPSFAYVAKGVEQQATAEGRLCMVCTTHGDPARELAVVEAMREQRADAVILVGGGSLDDSYIERMTHFAHALDKAGSRLVLCGRPPLGRDVPTTVVEYDNEGGAYAMTSHLLSQGHRHIVLLGADHPDNTSTTKRDRVRGFVRAHESFGVPHDPDLIIPAGFGRADGYEQARRLIALGATFTAVFAATDMVAIGVLAALREAGLRVPEDVSLAGYDDIPFAADLEPGLTTVHIPTEELGRTAVRLALNREERQHVVLGTHIVVRDSVRPPSRNPVG